MQANQIQKFHQFRLSFKKANQRTVAPTIEIITAKILNNKFLLHVMLKISPNAVLQSNKPRNTYRNSFFT